MYAHRSSRRGQRLRVFIAAAWSGTFGVLTVADARAANPRSPFESDPVAIPIEAGVSELDLNAGQTPVVAATSTEPVPLIQPDGAETGDTRWVFTPDCRDTGNYITTFAFSNVFRANIYSVNRDRVLKEFFMKLNVAQTGRTLYFYVYHRNPMTGKYERDLELPRTFSSSGLAYYSSGPITVSMPAGAGRFYLIGVAWTSPSVTFGLDTVTYPVTVPFGTIEGNSGLNSPPPLATPLTVSLNRNGAYGQRLCFDPLPGACCEGSVCSVVQRTACPGQFSEEGNTCDDVTCPLEVRACCFGEGCQAFTSFDCEYNGGRILAPPHMMGDCNTNGAIDLPDYVCFRDCLISTNGPPTAACLTEFDFPPAPDGAINLRDFAGLQATFTDSLPQDPCAGNPCELARGACCRMDGSCVDPPVTVDECLACPGSEWRGEGTSCLDPDFEPCPVLGCCEAACAVRPLSGPDGCPGGDWCPGLFCAESVCATAGCPSLGACCHPADGSCSDAVTQAACDASEGVFYPAPTRCCTSGCTPAPGACCLPDDTCSNGLTQVDCTAAGGTWDGPFTDCASKTSCIQGCCFDDGDCGEFNPNACRNFTGFPQGNGSDCSEPCPGACCQGTTCAPSSQGDCNAVPNSVWHGGQDCSDGPDADTLPDACQ